MPWKECHIMDERLRFVTRLLEGEKMKPLCAEFGISRKTGYKIFDRYKECGLGAFTDRRRRPYRQANRLPAPLEAVIVRLKREYPTWGAPKIREKLRQQFSGPHLPAISTVHAVLDRHGLVTRRRGRRSRATGTELSRPTDPNALWCADYKGEFLLGNRRYCYPLTITDFARAYRTPHGKRKRAKSTCACRPAGVSKRITGVGGTAGRTCRTKSFSCV